MKHHFLCCLSTTVNTNSTGRFCREGIVVDFRTLPAREVNTGLSKCFKACAILILFKRLAVIMGDWWLKMNIIIPKLNKISGWICFLISYLVCLLICSVMNRSWSYDDRAFLSWFVITQLGDCFENTALITGEFLEKSWLISIFVVILVAGILTAETDCPLVLY